MSALETWSEHIWIAEAPLRFNGVPLGARMTVLRLADGSRIVHSPIEISRGLRTEIDRCGTVKHVVSPNKLHHFYVDSAYWPTAP